MSSTVRTFTMPGRIVRGLLDGESMVNADPETQDMQAVKVLRSAEYRKAGKGSTAVLQAEPEIVEHIADYLFALLDQAPGLNFDRFGFHDSDIRSTIKSLEKQLEAQA